jgi:hypothetical protein
LGVAVSGGSAAVVFPGQFSSAMRTPSVQKLKSGSMGVESLRSDFAGVDPVGWVARVWVKDGHPGRGCPLR